MGRRWCFNLCWWAPLSAAILFSIPARALTLPSWVTAEAQLRIAGDDYADQYRGYQARETTDAGKPLFDFLFAYAAYQLNRQQEAALLLQRCLIVDDQHYPAMNLLADIYLGTSNVAAAKPLLDSMSSITAPVRYQRMAKRLRKRLKRSMKNKHQVQLVAGSGYDNNANFATTNRSFANFALDQPSRRADSSVIQLALSAATSKQLTNNWTANAAASVQEKNYSKAQFANSSRNALRLGVRRNQARHSTELTAQYQATRLDGEFNYQSAGATANYQHLLGKKTALTALVQASRISFSGAQPLRNHSNHLLSLGFNWQPTTNFNISINAITGRDFNLSAASPFGRHFYGSKLSLNGSTTAFRWNFQLGKLRSTYDGLFFLGARDDQYFWLHPSISRDIAVNHSLRLYAEWQHNESPEPLYAFRRKAIGLQWEWRLL